MKLETLKEHRAYQLFQQHHGPVRMEHIKLCLEPLNINHITGPAVVAMGENLKVIAYIYFSLSFSFLMNQIELTGSWI